MLYRLSYEISASKTSCFKKRRKDTRILFRSPNFFLFFSEKILNSNFLTENSVLTELMESIRQKQIGELVRRHFSHILTQEGAYIYGRDKLVTVTQVKMTPDLLLAKIYLSIYGVEAKYEVIEELTAQLHRLRQLLSAKIGKQMRRMPEIELYLDDTVDEMYRVDALLNRVQEEDQNIAQLRGE